MLIFTPLVALTILFGVAPKPVLDMSAASVAQLLDNYKHAIAAAPAAAEEVVTSGSAVKMERAEMIQVSAAR
jgi:hypothetical protein